MEKRQKRNERRGQENINVHPEGQEDKVRTEMERKELKEIWEGEGVHTKTKAQTSEH